LEFDDINFAKLRCNLDHFMGDLHLSHMVAADLGDNFWQHFVTSGQLIKQRFVIFNGVINGCVQVMAEKDSIRKPVRGCQSSRNL
jgi:hypothetical protein